MIGCKENRACGIAAIQANLLIDNWVKNVV